MFQWILFFTDEKEFVVRRISSKDEGSTSESEMEFERTQVLPTNSLDIPEHKSLIPGHVSIAPVHSSSNCLIWKYFAYDDHHIGNKTSARAYIFLWT